jgi:hypothetical protein
MIAPVLEIIKSAASFLRDGPNASSAAKQLAEDENHFASKKFFVIFTSFVTLILFFFVCVGILFLVPRDSVFIGGYVTIFTKTMEIFAVIIATYLGVQAAVDLRYSSSSNASMSTEVAETDVQENLTKNTKEPDYNITEVNNN